MTGFQKAYLFSAHAKVEKGLFFETVSEMGDIAPPTRLHSSGSIVAHTGITLVRLPFSKKGLVGF